MLQRAHDNIDFLPIIITKISAILPISVVTAAADKAHDSGEDNHVLVREELQGFSTYLRHINMYQYERHMEDTENKRSEVAIPNYCTVSKTKMKLYFQW